MFKYVSKNCHTSASRYSAANAIARHGKLLEPKTGRTSRCTHDAGRNTIQVTVCFSSVTPQFRGKTPGGSQRPPTSLPLPPTSLEELRLDGYLEYPHAARTLRIYTHPCLLRDSNPSSTAQQSASLTTIPDRRH
ncbi:hypothetical protein TNCV_3118881 [Trichonephila clavipes]|uniref:Uncharacterized protein n=1 Tax=Trichonephila clavipes TaxID=2585209 RepID=A0A8X6W989_TRICX|nr:hypothetical protein TNCV_3118881 [Trichonephila clavipes]